MKRLFLVLICFYYCTVSFAISLIETNDERRIECELIELNNEIIKYRPVVNNSSGSIFMILRTDVKNLVFDYNPDILNELDSNHSQQDTVSYKNEDSKIIVNNNLAASDLYVSNQSTQQIANQHRIEKALARVENYSGIYVFTDCEPLAKYEILGEVSFSGSMDNSSSFFMTSGFGTAMPTVISSSSEKEPQYTDIRNGLLTNAVMANRQVEGIILKLNNSYQGRATMIKFIDDKEDKALARVNSYMGVLVFTDCKPVHNYNSIGRINRIGGLNPNYNVLRDKLIRKSLKKNKNTEGVIPYLVSGGRDSGELIAF